MATIHEKLAKLEDVKQRVERFVEQGGDLNSKEFVPLGLEFVYAFDELAQEFGYKILKPIEKKADFIHPDPSA